MVQICNGNLACFNTKKGKTNTFYGSIYLKLFI